MAFVYGDRVKETSLTNGDGTLTLGGATVGFQSFAIGVGVANECFYGIVNTNDDTWEMGRGTVGPGTLSRDTVISSTNSNLLVDFTVGQKVVYTTVPRTFYEAALDAISHAAIDHTAAPLNLLDLGAHQGIDHTAAPFNLLATTQLPAEHELINHLAAPFNLLDIPAHNVIDHTAGPFNLLTSPLHESINHLAAPFNLLDEGQHDILDHTGLPGIPDPTPTREMELVADDSLFIEVTAPHGAGGAALFIPVLTCVWNGFADERVMVTTMGGYFSDATAFRFRINGAIPAMDGVTFDQFNTRCCNQNLMFDWTFWIGPLSAGIQTLEFQISESSLTTRPGRVLAANDREYDGPFRMFVYALREV